MNSFYTIVLYSAATILVAASDYCDKDLCKPWQGRHVACGHNYQFDRTCPRDASLVEITASLKEYLLKWHNEKRNLVAGGEARKHRYACRMGTMQWDDELAKLAELNVMQCTMDHECHNTKSYPSSGQNLAYSSYYGTPNYEELMQEAVNDWYSEIENSDMNIIKKFPENYSGPVITHFTGMMVEGNTRIGCAASTYSKQGEEYKIHLIACNMASTTMISKPVYRSCRTPGMKCKTGTNPIYPNLCSTSEHYKRP